MFKIYSEDLRERVVAHVEAGYSAGQQLGILMSAQALL